MKSCLRGIFLTSERPAETAAFYEKVAGLNFEVVGSPETYQYWKLDEHGVQLAIHDAQAFASFTFPQRPESNVTHLYFQIEDRGEFLKHLTDCRLQAFAQDDIVVTVLDPDGRAVMFGRA